MKWEKASTSYQASQFAVQCDEVILPTNGPQQNTIAAGNQPPQFHLGGCKRSTANRPAHRCRQKSAPFRLLCNDTKREVQSHQILRIQENAQMGCLFNDVVAHVWWRSKSKEIAIFLNSRHDSLQYMFLLCSYLKTESISVEIPVSSPPHIAIATLAFH